jgi:hypothetical protein
MARRFGGQSVFEKTKLIRASQCLGYALLSTALLGSSTCNQNNNRPGNKHLTLTPMPVAINSCTVLDPITTDNQHDVQWKSGDGLDYTITFSQTFDLNNSPASDITPFKNPTPPPASKGLPVPKDGSLATLPTAGIPTNCSIIGTSIGTRYAGCYLKYSIAYTGGSVCNDPGVHVIPTGGQDNP